MSTDNKRAEWIAERKTGIGSSDAAAVIGLNPYRSALEVYLDKTGISEDREDSEQLELGREIEPVLRRMYEKRTGLTLQGSPPLMRHSQHTFMIANLDDVREDGRIVELKNVGLRMSKLWGDDGTDEIPEYYICQVQHQMAVAGCDVADVCALIGGQRFKIFTVPRNERFIKVMIELEAQFWDRVVNLNPPEPDFTHPQALRAVQALVGNPASEKLISLNPSYVDTVRAFQDAKHQATELKKLADRYKAELTFAMQDAGTASVGGYMITRKTVNKREYTVAAQSYVDLRVKEPQGV